MLQYKKEDIQKTLNMAWPAMLESFFTAFAGLVGIFDGKLPWLLRGGGGGIDKPA